MPSRRRREGVGYVLRRFPKISETFVLNELLALEAQGQRVRILSLLPSRDPRFHAELGDLRTPIGYVPGPLEGSKLLRYNVRAFRRNPRGYLGALLEALRSDPRRGLWRLVQAGYVAERACGLRLAHLHAHFATEATTVASLAARIARLPYSFTAHAVDIYKNTVKPGRLVRHIDGAKFVVTVSEYNKRHLQDIANRAAHKVVRIYNGIRLDRFSPAGGSTAVEPFEILTVARLVEKKGPHVLVEACHLLRDRGLSFRCRIVGKGNERSRLLQLIKKWKLHDHVELLGAHTQAEILERYRSAQLFVLPCVVGSDGNREGLPVSIVEALACGLPVVTTPITGIPEAVTDGHNGVLVESGDPRSLAEALEALITDADLREHLGANARASVEAKFDLTVSSSALGQLFARGAP